MARISLCDVQARYELLNVREYNLKRRLVDLAQRRLPTIKSIQALYPLTLDIERGARLGLVGANGAGKSTLLSIMAGLLPPTSGRVRVEGRVLALLGGGTAGLDQEATGLDNIVSMGVQLGETPTGMRRRIGDITEFSGLADRVRHPVYTYSSGMQTRLRFSILTSLRPDVLLMDEGLGTADAAFTERANERLQQFITTAGIVVLASHGDYLLQQQCDSALWLDHGLVKARGPVNEVLATYHASIAVPPAETV